MCSFIMDACYLFLRVLAVTLGRLTLLFFLLVFLFKHDGSLCIVMKDRVN